MALDTKQKQGSALDIGMPFRQWLAEPVAALTSAEHLSLLKLCSEPAPGAAAIAGIGTVTITATAVGSVGITATAVGSVSIQVTP